MANVENKRNMNDGKKNQQIDLNIYSNTDDSKSKKAEFEMPSQRKLFSWDETKKSPGDNEIPNTENKANCSVPAFIGISQINKATPNHNTRISYGM